MAPLGQQHQIGEVAGIRVVTERVPAVSSVSIGAWIGVGSRDERDNQLGYAHFLEHLLFKGNDTWSATAINRWFDGIGSDANAATTKEYTVVHSRVLDRHGADALGMIGQIVWHPAFHDADIASEREVILEEIAMYNDSPSDVVHELADELVFGSHPLGRPIVGTEESIEVASRDSLAGFHADWYQPERIVVSAAGAVDHDEVMTWVEQRFLADVTSAPRLRTAELPGRTVPTYHAHSSSIKREAEQVHVCVTWPGLARSDDRRYAAAVLDTVLGATPGSRLFSEVRESRGLAYTVYSFASQFADAGQVGVYLAVRPDRVDEALTVVNDQIDRLLRDGITSEELDRAHRHLEGRTLLAMESTTVRGNRLGSSLITGMPIESVDTTVERIRSVDHHAVQEIAAQLLNPHDVSIAVVAEDPNRAELQAREALNVTGANQSRVMR